MATQITLQQRISTLVSTSLFERSIIGLILLNALIPGLETSAAMETQPFAWMYFVSFVVMGTFVIINLFIAVVINNLEEAKAARLAELRQPVSRDELLKELADTQQAMTRLRSRMEGME